MALADDHCKFSQPKSLDLDLAGVKAVVFEVNSHDLRLQASPAARAALSGRACASSQDLLGQLSLTQEKAGDKLVVRLQRENRGINIGFGSNYAWLDIGGTLPDDILVQLKVGSGDATLAGAQAMSADVGSGDVKARDIKALATAAVGSGDIELDNVGALHVVSIGSGDVRVGGVRGDARIVILDPKESFSKQGVFQEGWEKHYGTMIEWLGPKVHDGIKSVDPATNTVVTGFETYRDCALVNVVPAQMAGEIARNAGLAP
ncbi:MAG: hypothetical protein J0H45_02005, partial [Stenotrophomonas nitritireducens]|nr:hypothetical protein [Stenotrophomonas nitritireducens]